MRKATREPGTPREESPVAPILPRRSSTSTVNRNYGSTTGGDLSTLSYHPEAGTNYDGLISRQSSFAVESRSAQHRSLIPKPRAWYVAYYIPVLDWVSKYNWSAFPGDLCSGINLASFQIPISLSYATSLSGVDAICGMYGLIVAPMIYAFLGSVPSMVVAPEGPISLLIGKNTPGYLANPDHRHGRSDLDSQQLSALFAGSAGAIVLVLGLLRTGFLTNVLAQSLLRGFVTGVGVVMISDQTPAMLGIKENMHKALGEGASSYAKAKYTLEHWYDSDLISASFSFYALFAIVSFKAAKWYFVNKKNMKRAVLFPEIFLVVVVSTLFCKWGGYADTGLPVVGDVQGDHLETIWMLRPKYSSDFKINFQTSFFIALLGLLESTVAARMLGTGESNRSTNREMVALGAANLIGSMFGSLPSFGGYGRSKINLLSGGTTQMSAVVSSMVTLVCTYKLLGLLFYLPQCTLSAIIASVGLSLIEEAPAEVFFFWKVRAYSDLATLALSLLVTFFWSVEAGVTIGTGAALIRLIHHATRPRIQILSRNPATGSFENADEMQGMGEDSFEHNPEVLVVKVPEPLTFANSAVLESRLKRLELHRTTRVHPARPPSPRHQHLEVVIFHLKGMTECDASSATTMCRIVEGYLKRGIRVIFTEVVRRDEIQALLNGSGILDMLERQHREAFFPTVQKAIDDIDQGGYRSSPSIASVNHRS